LAAARVSRVDAVVDGGAGTATDAAADGDSSVGADGAPKGPSAKPTPDREPRLKLSAVDGASCAAARV